MSGNSRMGSGKCVGPDAEEVNAVAWKLRGADWACYAYAPRTDSVLRQKCADEMPPGGVAGVAVTNCHTWQLTGC